MLRAIGGFLFALNTFVIKGPYSDSCILYNKEEIERIRLYYRDKTRYKTQKISLYRPVRDSEGNFVRSKTKSVNAFVANYIHFLDATVCHFVVETFEAHVAAKSWPLEIATIHDSFFIKPEKAEDVKNQYRQALTYAIRLHIYNLFYWLHDICAMYKKTDEAAFEPLVAELEAVVANNKGFETNLVHIPEYVASAHMVELLEPIQRAAPVTDKAKWGAIIDYFKMEPFEDSVEINNVMHSNPGQLLFLDVKK